MIDPKDNLARYPSLESSFNKLPAAVKGNLTFEKIQEQLSWALDDYEQRRAIHRLHCVVNSFLNADNAHLQKLSDVEKQALIALTLMDGCKNSKESVAAFEQKGYTALKDGLSSFFNMVEKAPDIFPIYQQLSPEAQKAITDHFFYLPLRLLQLGEVPMVAVPSASLARDNHLMAAFWYANAIAFNLDRANATTPTYPPIEATGPTVNGLWRSQFDGMLEGIRQRNLMGYYEENSIFEGRVNLRKSVKMNAEAVFICRLGKMLSFIKVAENADDYVHFIADHMVLVLELAALEAETFIAYQLEAFNFMPSVLKALKERIMPDKTLAEVLEVFMLLQKQIYLSTDGMMKVLGNNRAIPLFGLSAQQDEMLKKFASAPDKSQFHFVASFSGPFIAVTLTDGPVPKQEATNSNSNRAAASSVA